MQIFCLDSIYSKNYLQSFVPNFLYNWGTNDSHGHFYLRGLWHGIHRSQNISYREFAAQVFAAVVPTAALYSQYIAQVVDFYLDNDKNEEREEIVRLATSNDENACTMVMAFVNTALRQRPPVRSSRPRSISQTMVLIITLRRSPVCLEQQPRMTY